MPWIAAGMVAAPIVAGVVGNIMAKGDKEAQKKAMKKAYEELAKVGAPPDLAKAMIVEEMKKQGVYTPKLEEDLSDSFADSEMAKIKPDKALSKERMASLAGIKMLSKTGLGAEDRAAMNEMQNRLRAEEKASTASILNKLQSQGMGGSGAALMAALGGGQQAANLASQEAGQQMAQASSARRQALAQLGQQAGEMQQQDFNREATIASAMDERNRFLQENSIARQQRNVGSLNQAQATNLAENQRLHEANIAARRAEAERQAREKGSQWDRSLTYGQSLANARTGQAQQYAQQAANTAASIGQIGSGVGTAFGAMGSAQGPTTSTNANTGVTTTTGGSALGNWMSSDENGKENIDESGNEVQSFMDRISKKYK